jgi:hypothetical protein
MECLAEISRKALQDNRQSFLAEQERQLIKRFTSRIIAAVIQESKTSDVRQYIFTDFTTSDTSTACPIQYVGQLIEGLQKRLPDCDIEYSDGRGIIIDWT